MSNTNNNSAQTSNVSDPIQAAIDAQREIQTKKGWKASELSKAKKARNAELKLIDNACDAMLKDVNDNIMSAQIKLGFEAKKLEVKAAHEPAIRKLKMDLEAISEGVSQVAGEKVGAVIAPVSKGVKGFFGSLKERAL